MTLATEGAPAPEAAGLWKAFWASGGSESSSLAPRTNIFFHVARDNTISQRHLSADGDVPARRPLPAGSRCFRELAASFALQDKGGLQQRNCAHDIYFGITPKLSLSMAVQLCKEGSECTRRVCFFAHNEHELRYLESGPYFREAPAGQLIRAFPEPSPYEVLRQAGALKV